MFKTKPNIRAIKLWHSLCPSYFPLVVGSAFFGSITPYFNVYMSAEIINGIARGRSNSTLLALVLMTIIGNFVISALRSLIRRELNHRTTILNQREALLFNSKTLSLDYEDQEKTEVRQLRRKIAESAKINGHGKQSLINSFNDIVYNIINIILATYLFTEMVIIIVSSEFSYILVLFFIIFAVLISLNIWVNFFVEKIISRVSNDVSQAMIEENRIDNAIDSYNMGKDVRLYRQDKLIMNIRHYTLKLHKKAFKKLFTKQFHWSLPATVLSFLLQVNTYIFICFYVLKEALEIGSIIKYIGFMQRLIDAIISMFNVIGTIKYNTPFIEDYLSFLDITQKKQQGTLKIERRTLSDSNNEDFEIEFRDVSFKYPGSDNYALRNVSIKFHIGDRLAIVGMNGSGKTTMIKLLCRLYDPTEGEILFNGININKYEYDEYMSIFTVVFQDFKLFSFSLGQNVATRVDYDKARVESCLCEAGFQERINTMTDGVETCLYRDFEKNGVEISGGEAQKIALARALYKNAPFIVLDEPTAALDPIAEFEIYSKFNEIVGDKTAIYISHRLSSCRFCDDIAVFHEGELIQRGNHNTLLSDRGGKYFELWNAQAQYYNEKSNINT